MVDLTVGEATVGSALVGCGGVADLALQCTRRRIVLIDVLRSEGRVRLLGAASRRFAGKRVKIRFLATGKVVARPRSAAPASSRPRRSCRAGRCAPPTARATGPRSPAEEPAAELVRRMLVSRTSVKGGRVTIAGRVVRPLG